MWVDNEGMRWGGWTALGIGLVLGAAVAFGVVAWDNSRRAVEVLGKAYEASMPEKGTPVVQVRPVQNPPEVSGGSGEALANEGGRPFPVRDEQVAQEPLWASKDTPEASGQSGTLAAGEAASRPGTGAEGEAAFLGVRCEDRSNGAYVVDLWPGSGWDRAFLVLGGIPPEPYGIHKPALPALLGALYSSCTDLARDIARYKPGDEYHLDLFTPDYPARSEYIVSLVKRPANAGRGWY